MKKLLTISGLIFFVFKLSERLLNDLMPAMHSNESLAYKAGFIVGLLITILVIAGLAFQTYQMFASSKPAQAT
ncbi:hypothetical protein [Fodinibius sp. Rm-B-1B1-1]|uniref:hypothetical protein n=1 Tax=Fodinibius alkaliphilus TaxID=3140241 RepID=UPI003159AC9A